MQKRILPFLLVSLAPTLCGCASLLADLPAPLARTLPATCQRLLTPQPLPDVKASDDARVSFVKDDAALITANRRITAAKACEDDLVRAYSKGSVK